MRILSFTQAPVETEPVPQTGRPPRMNYYRWNRIQGVEVGGVTVSKWYWRCPSCRVWAGAYPDALRAKRRGTTHKRSHQRTRKAARR